MAGETGRNTQQPDYLNEKAAAEDRQGKKPEEGSSPLNENRKEAVINDVIANTFEH